MYLQNYWNYSEMLWLKFKVKVTWYFFIWADVCSSFFLAHVQGQIAWPLMDAHYLTFIHVNTGTNKQLSSFLWTREGIRCACSIIKSNLVQEEGRLFFISETKSENVIQISDRLVPIEVRITSEPKSRVFMSPAQGPYSSKTVLRTAVPRDTVRIEFLNPRRPRVGILYFIIVVPSDLITRPQCKPKLLR